LLFSVYYILLSCTTIIVCVLTEPRQHHATELLAYLLTQLWGAKRLVEIEGGADQGKVRKCLGEIPSASPLDPISSA